MMMSQHTHKTKQVKDSYYQRYIARVSDIFNESKQEQSQSQEQLEKEEQNDD